MTNVTETIKVKGTSFRQNFLQYARKCEKFWCQCRRQKKNENDPNAILVWATCVRNGNHKTVPVGYLPKELAEELAPAMDEGTIKLYATTGTAEAIASMGIDVTAVSNATESNEIVTLLEEGKISLSRNRNSRL